MLLLLPGALVAQTRAVSGIVKNSMGNPLEGVSVTIKNEGTGTSTAADGRYKVSVAPGAVLVFSMVNFDSYELKTGSALTYNIILKQSELSLDSVVVIGYGTIKRKDATIAIGSVNVKDLQKAPVRSFDEALAGRVAGVQVSSTDGQPGGGINILIRGIGSISQDASPLYVIDGFPMYASNFNTNQLDPNNIESIEVLKDAAATAIYGSSGANGVILISTKRGKLAPPSIAFNTWYGLQKNIKDMKMLDTRQWTQLQIDNTMPAAVYTNPSLYPPNYNQYVFLTNPPHPFTYFTDSTSPVSMQDIMFRSGSSQNYSLDISGGNDKTKYSLSGNYNDQLGTIINSGYKRYLGKISLDQIVNNKLKVGISASYVYTQQSGISPSAVALGSNSGSMMYSILGYKPFIDKQTPDAVYESATDPSITSQFNYFFNPYVNQSHLVRLNGATTLLANGYAEYAITPKLKFRSTVGINYVNSKNVSFNDSLTLYGSPRTVVGQSGPNGSVNQGGQTNWVNENTLTYNTSFNRVHNVSALLGESQQSFKYSAYTATNTGLANPGLGIGGLGQSNNASGATVGESSTSYTKVSGFARLMYNYNSKYYLSATLRKDATSRFAEGNRWGTFPAASAKWTISNESFWKRKIKAVISDAAVRLSYGKVGNDKTTNDYPTLTLVQTGIAPLGGYTILNSAGTVIQIPGAYVPTAYPGNPGIQWESQESYNLGFDLGFFKNRINLTLEAYSKTSDKLIYTAPIPTSTGFKLLQENIGKIRNQGLEISLSTNNISTKRFQWTSSFNISFTANKVIDLAGNVDAALFNPGWNNGAPPAYILKKGQPLGLMYGLLWDGNYQYSDFTQNAAGQYILKDNVPSNQTTRSTSPTSAPQPGDIKFKDINGDGVITANDNTTIGRGYPLHFGGFGNNFSYKNFDLNIFLQWSYGNDIQNANRMVFENSAATGINQFETVKDRWTPQNQNNTLFRAGQGAPSGPNFMSTRTIEDGSFLRLKTINVGYNLPRAMLNKWRIKQVRFYISGQNLVTWTKYTSYDPEVSTFYNILTPGFDWGAYPRARTMTIGANVTF